MIRRLGSFLVAVALVVLPATSRAADPEPTVTLRIRPLAAILQDAKYLAEMVGQGDAIQLVEGQANQISGIDLKKPLGAYATLSPGIVDSNIAILVPVTSEKEFVDLLGILGQNPAKDNDGIYTVAVPQIPFPVHFRIAHGYAYITVRDKEPLGKDKLLAPAKIFPAGQEELVSLNLRFDRIPNELRQLAVSQLELRMPELLEQKEPGETEAQRKFRTAAIKEMGKFAGSVLKECKEIRLTFDLDRKTHTTSLQLSVDGVDKSGLAASISTLAKTNSPVAGLLQGDNVMNFGTNVALPADLTKTLWAALDESIRKELEKQNDPAAKNLVTKLMKALEPVVLAGKLQTASAFQGPSAAGRMVAISGMAVPDGKALEQAMRNIVQDLPAEAKALIKLDETKAGAVNIHRVNLPPEALDQNARKMFGDGPVYAAITPQVIFFALGENSLEMLKKALTLKPGAAPLLSMDMSLSRLAAFDDSPDANKALAIAKKVFQGADKNKDRVRILLEGGNALKLRIESHTTLVKFFYELSQIQ